MKYRGKEVGYQRIVMFYEPQGDKLEVLIDGKPFNDIKTLAANDGLTVPVENPRARDPRAHLRLTL